MKPVNKTRWSNFTNYRAETKKEGRGGLWTDVSQRGDNDQYTQKEKETEKESRREVFPLLDSRIETLVDEQGEKTISSLT